MEALDRMKNIDRTYKIGLLLFAALLIGVVATSFQSNYMGVGHSQDALHDTHYDQNTALSGSVVADKGGAQRDVEDSGQGKESSDRKIVTTVRTTLRVNDVSSAQEDVRQRVDSYNGFIESSSIDQRNSVSGRITVAVPEENISSFTGGLESDYRIESESSDRTDVTDRYNELEAELESKKQEMRQLEELMNESENVDELIKVQERMSDLRSRIDFLQQQLEDLDERVTYSKVYITFEGPELLKASFDLRETLFDAYRAVFESVRLMILGAAYLLPFVLLIGLYKVVTRRFRS